MTIKEQKRLKALELVGAERMTVDDATHRLSISERFGWRILGQISHRPRSAR